MVAFGLPEARGLAYLDPKFAQERDERISFGHTARVQQPARARNQQPGRLPAGSPRARTHPTKFPARIQPDLRTQIVHALSKLDSCTRGWMGGRACDGMESTARTARALVVSATLEFARSRFLKHIEQRAPSISLRLWEKYSIVQPRCRSTTTPCLLCPTWSQAVPRSSQERVAFDLAWTGWRP